MPRPPALRGMHIGGTTAKQHLPFLEEFVNDGLVCKYNACTHVCKTDTCEIFEHYQAYVTLLTNDANQLEVAGVPRPTLTEEQKKKLLTGAKSRFGRQFKALIFKLSWENGSSAIQDSNCQGRRIYFNVELKNIRRGSLRKGLGIQDPHVNGTHEYSDLCVEILALCS